MKKTTQLSEDEMLEQEDKRRADRMAYGVALFDRLLKESLGKASINREDIPPFCGFLDPNDMNTFGIMYFPVDTIIERLIEPTIASLMKYLEEKQYEQEEPLEDFILQRPLDVACYVRGMVDMLIGLAGALEIGIMEAGHIYGQTLMQGKSGNESGMQSILNNPTMTALDKASMLINKVNEGRVKK